MRRELPIVIAPDRHVFERHVAGLVALGYLLVAKLGEFCCEFVMRIVDSSMLLKQSFFASSALLLPVHGFE